MNIYIYCQLCLIQVNCFGDELYIHNYQILQNVIVEEINFVWTMLRVFICNTLIDIPSKQSNFHFYQHKTLSLSLSFIEKRHLTTFKIQGLPYKARILNTPNPVHGLQIYRRTVSNASSLILSVFKIYLLSN